MVLHTGRLRDGRDDDGIFEVRGSIRIIALSFGHCKQLKNLSKLSGGRVVGRGTQCSSADVPLQSTKTDPGEYWLAS